ncbi:hypothetical protein H4V97_000877 [Flavobacterium sp. CG_23.5]|uniref:hypothetical protein n=1 Tax=unclassified Flavobacterium TaxID=196869 RepID=UPI0018CB3709|nr:MULTISPECIES: hypothetical protein [unclassified Flavobacterium]MBG6111112.1 hypothetical protein [Flavobacterium sp. CG_9.10]MBP2282559.1 hypothetical protein [Flavobacterium sp. CG_23.5]
MTKIKKIAIISTHSFGYVDFIVEKLNLMESVDLTYVNIDSISFSYKNIFSRVNNFFSKLFLSQGLKEKNRTNFIKKLLEDKGIFDQVLIIRPDKLQKEALICLRENSIEMTSYLFDGIENYKEQKKTLHFFDTVYSYDKKDVEKYNFQFLPNYIYDDEILEVKPSQTVFNISSFDKRFLFLEKIANYLEAKNISFHFIVRKSKKFDHHNIEIIEDYLSLQEVKKLIAKSKILVDIQRENQYGLSFRVFEALGYRRKLITNNHDIVNYDFYDKNNIWVISETNYEIPTAFFETDYNEIKLEILNKYMLSNWISVVFNVD